MKIHKVRRTKLQKRDARGRIRQMKGKLPNGKTCRIQIADIETSDAEATRRLNVIHSLYEKQCARFSLDCWSVWCLAVAKQLGAGHKITDDFLMTLFNEATTASTAALLMDWGIPVSVSDAFQNGMSINKDQVESLIAEMVQKKMKELTDIKGPIVKSVNLPDSLCMTETATLFDALDSYISYLELTGDRDENNELKAKVYKNVRDINRLKFEFAKYKGMPLWKLDLHKFKELVAIWQNRPLTRMNTRSSVSWAQSQIKILFRFARWLATSPNFNWSKPEGFDDIDRKIVPLGSDDNGEVFQTITKQTYSPEELAEIMRHTDDFGKMIIATCVNCAFGQSEIGQWKTSRMVKRHPYLDKIKFDATEDDFFLVGPRPKTKRYGEHLLWEEVSQAIKPFLDGRELLWMTRTGQPIYKTHSKQPSSEIAKWWGGILDKVVKDNPDFQKLPFGSLRDILPNIFERDVSEKVAKLALQHDSFTEDKLMRCYANLPFKRLFEATKELKPMFQPMLDELGVS
ncbi:MAG: hypothetical protein JKY95_10765 [Planctomycetaceae bacterium]|nr:hypothetical protein [Planctomycetaceae bacterium]